MKKRFGAVAGALLSMVVASMTSCTSPETSTVAGVSLNEDTLTVYKGQTARLVATVLPENAPNKDVLWATDDSYIAGVRNGVVSGRNIGEALIIVTTADGGKTDSCLVRVEEFVPAQSITISGASSVAVGTTTTLVATVAPDTASSKAVTWSSSAPGVAMVADGIVTGIASGHADITATTVIGGIASAAFGIDVFVPVVGVSSVNIQEQNVSILEGADLQLTISVLPANASDPSVELTSSNTNIATVSPSGLVHGVAEGPVTITATSKSNNAVFDACAVEVVSPSRIISAVGISMEPDRLYLVAGSSSQLEASVLPSSATNRAVAWATSNGSVATVSQTGSVQAVGPGSATITAVSDDGGYEAACAVTVTALPVPVTDVSIPDSLTIDVGSKARLAAVILPEAATDKSLSWSSDAKGIATVEDGIVTGVSPGTATISVTAAGGAAQDSCTVTVASSGTVIIIVE